MAEALVDLTGGVSERLHVGVRERLHVAVDGGGEQSDVNQVDAHARPRQPVKLCLPSCGEAQGAGGRRTARRRR